MTTANLTRPTFTLPARMPRSEATLTKLAQRIITEGFEPAGYTVELAKATFNKRYTTMGGTASYKTKVVQLNTHFGNVSDLVDTLIHEIAHLARHQHQDTLGKPPKNARHHDDAFYRVNQAAIDALGLGYVASRCHTVPELIAKSKTRKREWIKCQRSGKGCKRGVRWSSRAKGFRKRYVCGACGAKLVLERDKGILGKLGSPD